MLPDPELADDLEALAGRARGHRRLGPDRRSSWRASSRLTPGRPRVSEQRLARSVDALIGAGDTRAALTMQPEVESLRETPLRNAVLGYLAVVRGRPGEAEAWLGRAWDLVNVRARARHGGADLPAVGAAQPGALPGCGPGHLGRPRRRPGATRIPVAVEAAAIRGLGVAAVGDPRQALADYERLAAEVSHGAQAQRVAMGKGWLHLQVDEVDEARAGLESARPRTSSAGPRGSRCGRTRGWPAPSSRRGTGTTPCAPSARGWPWSRGPG